MIAYYTVDSDEWSAPATLYNLPYEIVVDNTTTNMTETSISLVVHEGTFVITWVRERVVVSYFVIC